MQIAGIQKLTLLDFPGRCAATIFTPGCDLRCPFCHNASLVDTAPGAIDPESILEFLKERKGRLTGLAITGGEPLMQAGIIDFMEAVRGIGYAIKLDTNGTYPERLKEILDKGLADYVAVDLKNSWRSYPATIGLSDEQAAPVIEKIKSSLGILKSSGIEFELRSTIVKELHSAEDVELMAQVAAEITGKNNSKIHIQNDLGLNRQNKTLAEERPASDNQNINGHYFLQSFKDSGDILCAGYSAWDSVTMHHFLSLAQRILPSTELRGVD